jgi:hypothetical protein
MTIRTEDTYTQFLVRGAKSVDIIGHPYFDSPSRRKDNLVYAQRTGPRQDMVLFGPRETYAKVRVGQSMVTFLEPFSQELWALVLAGLVTSSVIMYILEAEENPAFQVAQATAGTNEVEDKKRGAEGEAGGGAGEAGAGGEAGAASKGVSKEGPKEGRMDLMDGLFLSLYLSMTGFTGAGGHSPVTRAGRVYQVRRFEECSARLWNAAIFQF